MITPFLYIFAFGIGLGRNVSVDGGSYLSFLIPGMVALNSMNISFNTIAAPLNMSRIYHHTLETYLFRQFQELHSFLVRFYQVQCVD